jgi:hypothetical protein
MLELPCTARPVLEDPPGIRNAYILLEYNNETPKLNVEAVSHALDPLK